MKNLVINSIKIIDYMRSFGLILLFLLLQMYVFAQDGSDSTSQEIEKISPALKLSVVKNNNGTRTLSGTLAYRDKETKEFKKVNDVQIAFYTGVDSLHQFGIFKTDENGKAKFEVPADFNYAKNEEGLIHFVAEFKGDDKFEPALSEVDLIDADIKLFLEVIDSIRTVRVQASKILADGKIEPFNEEAISIYVGRMFSHLKIGEITLTEGEGTFEFPADIPGDSLGMVNVFAKFDDHETYATVLKSGKIDWGLKTSHHTVYHPRSLWTAVAPVWMIVTLSIMLLGVWGHYIYTVIQLIRLKKLNIVEKIEEK